MEKKYGGKHFNKIVAQNDIMVFVGNGFDIKILKKLNTKILPLYQKFFDFLEYAECNKENKLFLKMKQDKGNTENWCDFENALYELIPTGDLDELNEHLFELQTLFSMFLSNIVTTEVIKEIGSNATKYNWAINSLENILGDLDTDSLQNMNFSKNVIKNGHHQLFVFKFYNFNYTSLLDNYIDLDRQQFKPVIYKTSSNNFHFKINNDILYSNVILDIVHPNGIQSIPKSILFGYERKGYNEFTDEDRFFIKSYWTRADIRYSSDFLNTKLFIIYGMSIGKSDSWWWEHIFYSLKENGSELIIYNYTLDIEEDKEQVKQRFINNSIGEDSNISTSELNKIKEHIYVVNFNDQNDTKLFNMEMPTV